MHSSISSCVNKADLGRCVRGAEGQGDPGAAARWDGQQSMDPSGDSYSGSPARGLDSMGAG